MVENTKEDGILNEVIEKCNYYERIIIKIFKKLFIKCYNIQRINIANIFLE